MKITEIDTHGPNGEGCKVEDCCCEIMQLACEIWKGCTPNIIYDNKDLSEYDPRAFDGFYIRGCDEGMPLPINFCPWCGKEIII